MQICVTSVRFEVFQILSQTDTPRRLVSHLCVCVSKGALVSLSRKLETTRHLELE